MGLKYSRFDLRRGDDDDKKKSSAVVVVVGSEEEGRVRLYDRPVCAREVMKEFPTHLICHSDSFFIGHKLPPLSHDDQLRLGNTYFLLPNHFFRSVLSFLTVANSLCMIVNKKENSSRLFDIHRTEGGMLQIRISEDVLMDMITVKEESKTSSVLCSTTELEKEYNQLANRSARELWKPTLDTIHELYHSPTSHSKRRTTCWFPMQLSFSFPFRRNNN